MRIAFYAPMKSPRHSHPSGDRRIGKLLIQALQTAGHTVAIISDLRAWEGRGNTAAQQGIQQQATTSANKLIAAFQNGNEPRPDLCFTYHLYHKAPDWIGPRLAAALNLPYVVAEASYGTKQLNGPWASGCQQVLQCLLQSTAIINLNPNDSQALARIPGCASKMHRLEPFLDTEKIDLQQRAAIRLKIAEQYRLDPKLTWLVSVAMMRDDVKLESYARLAASLSRIEPSGWQLLLIGDGKARPKVEHLFGGALNRNTRFSGLLDQATTLATMTACDLFVWPALNEAIGMAILEAQACGLPVVAGRSGAIPAIVSHAESGMLYAPDDVEGMAVGISQLIKTDSLRSEFSRAAVLKCKRQHSLTAASEGLDRIVRQAREVFE